MGTLPHKDMIYKVINRSILCITQTFYFEDYNLAIDKYDEFRNDFYTSIIQIDGDNESILEEIINE